MSTVQESLAAGARLLREKRWAEAEAHLRAVLAAAPNHAEALHFLGMIAGQTGRLAEGIDFLRRAVAIDSTRADFHSNLGSLYGMAQAWDQSAACYERALALNARSPHIHLGLGNVWSHRKNFARARMHFEKALELKPEFPEAQGNLARANLALNEPAQAAAWAERALARQPGLWNAQYTLGEARRALDQLDAARDAFRAALTLNPKSHAARQNLAGILIAQDRLTEAAEVIDAGLAQDDQDAGLHFANAVLHLQQGDFAKGWAEYEWRRKLTSWQAPMYTIPAWDGSPLAGRRVLIHVEQGLGDTFQFLRFVPRLRPEAGAITLHCPPAIASMLKDHPAFDRMIEVGAPITDCDVWVPLLSLPHFLKLGAESMTLAQPLLNADAVRTAEWKARLADLPRPLVALAWRGNPQHSANRQRSFALADLEPLRSFHGTFIAVQQGAHFEATGGFPIRTFADFDAAGAFLDTAAVLKNVDLLIACDSAVAHLAGSLFVPTWLALAYDCDWRWHRNEQSVWYPRHRLFRQSRAGDWPGVFRVIAADLRAAYGSPAE